MRRHGWAVSILAAIALCAGAQTASANMPEVSACQHDRDALRCVKVLKNYDGDTLTVNVPGVHPLLGDKVSVRVAGIDTPEVKGRGRCEKDAARAAKDLLASVLRGAKQVDLLNVRRDKYFRILADVQVDGRQLKDVLLKNRLAVLYDGGTKQAANWCEYLRRPAGVP